jgi:hypothetical protein
LYPTGKLKGKGNEGSADVIQLQFITDILIENLPTMAPKEFETKLLKLHGTPYIWWISRFVDYLMRENKDTMQLFANANKMIKIKKPYVG